MRDWENLRYFMAVARNGTISGAAREFGVSHSTVIRRIEQFEKGLDSKLFKRLQRGYELTSAGKKLYSNGQEIEAKVDKALSQAEGHYDVIQGKLRISQPEIGAINIYPFYTEFRRQNPDITLEIHSTMKAYNINQQEVDVVLRFGESPPDLLVGRCLGLVKSRIYASKRYLQSLPKNYSSSDYDWIVWRRTAKSTAEKWFEKNVDNPRVVLRAESIPDVMSAVLSGMGVAFLSSHEARQHSNLVELFDGVVVNEHKLWLLTHRDLRDSERVKTFMRFMAENLQLE